MTARSATVTPPTDSRRRLGEVDRIIGSIGSDAVLRDRDRALPRAEVTALAAAGFGALRVPVAYGGLGQSVTQLAETLIDLGAADSNVAQIFRGHLGLVELLSRWPRSEGTEHLLRAVAAGEFFGPAGAERGPTDLRTLNTQLTDTGTELHLGGEKYYTTGSLFADWLHVLVTYRGELTSVVVPRNAPGVEIVDDWNGFGQRLTASGTARFRRVPVSREHVFANADPVTNDYIDAFYQFVHSATQAGIVRRLADDLATLVRDRTRSYPLASTPRPQDDPQVLEVVGKVQSYAYGARANVLALAASFDDFVSADPADVSARLEQAVIASASTQVLNSALLKDATWSFFDAASASAVDRDLGLDRHWRNARTVSSHNPSIYKASLIGGHAVNGTLPGGYLNIPGPVDR